MNGPTVSVIVPVYTVEMFLPRCLDSILRQDFKDFELILVDDGSKDSSGAICDEYKAKDERILVIHQEYAGVSAARNAGIDSAKGTYIAFVDSDDWVADDYISTLLNNMPYDVDLVVGGTQDCLLSDSTLVQSNTDICAIDISKENASALADKNKNDWFDYSICKLYRRELINNCSVRFVTGKQFGEDTFFALDYLVHCRRCVLVSKNLYAYVRYGDNTLSSANANRLNERLNICNKLQQTIQRIGLLNEDMKDVIYRRKINAAWRVVCGTGRDFKKLFSEKRNVISDTLSMPDIREAIDNISVDKLDKRSLSRYNLLKTNSIDCIILKCMLAKVIDRIAMKLHLYNPGRR